VLIEEPDFERARAWMTREDGLRLLLRNRLASDPEQPRRAFVDNRESPRLALAIQGITVLTVGDPALYAQAAADLFHLRLACAAPWPDAAAEAEWAKEPLGRRLILQSCPKYFRQAILDAGFVEQESEHGKPHYLYYVLGEPHLSRFVVHPCRLGVGMELYDCLRSGIGYDESGEYTRECLEKGPSFVCELHGEKMCWACTHLSGSMGMIYTPPPHRRNGYGRSLAAFQTDHMLRRDGYAFCHVNEENVASYSLLDSLGLGRLPEPLTGRTVLWPTP
jgi:ribosomal protein S18 acetylase RimI-like enzyme